MIITILDNDTVIKKLKSIDMFDVFEEQIKRSKDNSPGGERNTVILRSEMPELDELIYFLFFYGNVASDDNGYLMYIVSPASQCPLEVLAVDNSAKAQVSNPEILYIDHGVEGGGD